jgi:hypothetical protein
VDCVVNAIHVFEKYGEMTRRSEAVVQVSSVDKAHWRGRPYVSSI